MPDNADFVERRRHRIGASDVAAGLTGSFGSSPASIIARKLGLIDDEPTDRMRLGLALEDTVIDAAAALLRLEVAGRQVEVPHPEWPWLVATVDAVIKGKTAEFPLWPLEVKTTSNPEGYPEQYLEAQLAVQCACLGVPVGYSAVRNLQTWDLRVRKHYIDDDLLAAANHMAQALWEYLSTGAIPSAMFPSDSALWNRLRPQSKPDVISLPPDLVDDLVQAKDEAARAANRYDVLEAHVKEILGDCELGTVNGIPRIRWRTVTSRRVDLKSLETEAPDLVEAHRKESTARRFGVVAPIKQPHINLKEN